MNAPAPSHRTVPGGLCAADVGVRGSEGDGHGAAAGRGVDLVPSPPVRTWMPDPFAAFVARHRRDVYRLAHRLAGEHAAADDLVQETFVQAWEAFETLRHDGAAGAWLRRIAVRRYLNTHRAPWHRRVVRGLFAAGHDGDPAFDPACPGAPPGDPTFEGAVARGLARLSERERAAFVLRHLDDRSTADTAAAMQVSEGTVKTLLSRAVAKMHAHLTPYA